ncbi:MAG: hypothetical protein DLM68_19560 [Hyphomicrobiales bacterium]|nr:MAG: hypothetical protein DLM68_19560 [Hyphomicrobiales bacterium]
MPRGNGFGGLIARLWRLGKNACRARFLFKGLPDGLIDREALGSLEPGDALFYASKDNVNSYEHSAILVGPTNIACHTTARIDRDYNDVDIPWITLLKWTFPAWRKACQADVSVRYNITS